MRDAAPLVNYAFVNGMGNDVPFRFNFFASLFTLQVAICNLFALVVFYSVVEQDEIKEILKVIDVKMLFYIFWELRENCGIN
jgi:hypothetical protein